MSLKEIKRLIKAEKFGRALAKLERMLPRHQECPDLWIMRGDLIQLHETQEGPPLKEAATSYRKALKLDPNNLDAIESLAHFYDAVDLKPARAKHYAEAYIAKAKCGLAEMERVVTEGA